MSRQLVRRRTVLAAAIVAFGSGNVAVQAEREGPPPGAAARGYVSDAERGPARTGLLRDCVRTGTWTPGAIGSPCGEPAVAKTAEPPAEPPPAQTTAAPVRPSVEPEFYPEPEPKDMVPVPPMTASTEIDDRISDPIWYYDEDRGVDQGDGIIGRWVNPRYDEEIAAAEAQARQEAAMAQAAAAAQPVPPEPASPIENKPYVVKTLTLDVGALFAFNKSELTPGGRQNLDSFVRELTELQYQTIQVTGHADRIGSPKYNMNLSRARASAVKRYLGDKGIEPGRIVMRGVGSTEPVTKPGECSGKLKRAALIECLRPDRRVEVLVLARKEE